MTDRIIIGQRNTNEFGFFLSKPGKSVWSTNPDDFLLDTTNLPNQAKNHYMHGTVVVPVTYTGSAFSAQQTIVHNLGFVPVVLTQMRQGAYIMTFSGTWEYGISLSTTTAIIFVAGSSGYSGAAEYSFDYQIFATRLL